MVVEQHLSIALHGTVFRRDSRRSDGDDSDPKRAQQYDSLFADNANRVRR